MLKKNKIKNEVRQELVDEQSAKLFLYGDIADWDGCISLNSVMENLNDTKGKDLEVHINSYGGDIFESIAISNLLKQQEGKVTVVVDGIAASGGSIIAMAGDEIRMYSNSQMMIHNPWTFAIGNAKELREIADSLEKMEDSLRETYKDRFNGNEEDLKMLLDEEMYMTAQDAKDYGLCDLIIGEKEAEKDIEALIESRVQEALNKLNKGNTKPVKAEQEEVTTNKLYKLFI